MSYITIKNLTKSYGKNNPTPIIKNISFEIESGKSVAIIGKSGSGKSTLLHLLSGLLKPTDGVILFEGQEISKYSERQRDNFRSQNIGFIFQSFYLLPNGNALENVMLPLEIVGSKKAKEKAIEYLKLVGLGDKLYAKTKDLSGGQKQRVCIARALVNSPKVIFADEPTGNLDSETAEQIMELLFEISKKLGTTLIIVTHDHDIMAKCERGIHILDGKVGSIDNFS
jgi:putative ABC transport system ATP-binding protein